MYNNFEEKSKLIVKVDSDSGITNMIISNTKDSDTVVYSMICYFNAHDVRTAFSTHDLPYTSPTHVIIEFYDGRVIEVTFAEQDTMKKVEKFISHIFKMKMSGTKWAEEHPEQYI